MILHVNPTAQEGADGLTCETPLCDIQSAYDQLEQNYRSGMLEGAGVILLQAGNYVLQRPLHFTADFPVEIRAEEPGRVFVSGGKPLEGWQKTTVNGKDAWKTVLPVYKGDLPILYLDGRLATAARWPKSGMFRVTDERTGFRTPVDESDTFHLAKGDFNPAWSDIGNIHIRMLHRWIDEWLQVESYDDATCCVTTAHSIRYVTRKGDTEVVFHNVKEALTEPGEYYFDRSTRELFLITDKQEAPSDAVIPSRDALVRLDGGARWVTLSGITFQYAGHHLPVWDASYDIREVGLAPLPASSFKQSGYGKPFISSGQGAIHVPGAIAIDHASDCTIKDCTVRCCSGYGIHICKAARNLNFRGNHLHELGAGAILVNGADWDEAQTDPSLQVSHLVIQGNHIHDGGLIFPAATGILIQHAWACLIEDNHIHDLFYSGISAGWVWGYAPSMTHDIRIHRNVIHDLGKGLLSDMGGVYLLGRQPGTHVWENIIHTIVNRYYGGWGLYTDEGSSHIVLEKNLVYDCACEAFHQHYGSENTIRFNVFAFNGRAGMAVAREAFLGYACPGDAYACNATITDNVIITDGQAVLRVAVPALHEAGRIITDANIGYDATSGTDVRWGEFTDGKPEPTFTFKSLKEWQAVGQDRHSCVADPGFRNLKKRDFRLKKSSILRDTPFSFLEELLP